MLNSRVNDRYEQLASLQNMWWDHLDNALWPKKHYASHNKKTHKKITYSN